MINKILINLNKLNIFLIRENLNYKKLKQINRYYNQQNALMQHYKNQIIRKE